MSYTLPTIPSTTVHNGEYILSSSATGTAWTNTITAPVTLTKDGLLEVEDATGEVTNIGRAAKMFMWWMQTYHPEIEEQFDAVEDTKRGLK